MAKKKEEVGNYLIKEKNLEFISSGCTLLDCVLGGGWPIGRVSNVIGNASTNKSGISIEAMANFRKQFPDGYIWYQDAEAAFDVDYAITLGLPTDDKISVIDDTRDITKTYGLMLEAVDTVKENKCNGIYVLDTLDAPMPLDEKGELAEGYDAAKRAALINSMITKITPKVEEANIHLMIISQTRENVGALIGDKYRVSGGKALSFYASQRLWLTERGKLTKTVKGIKRAYGIDIIAKAKKNKIGLPFRECEFPVIFNYGIDDITANLEFLSEVKGGLEELELKKDDIKEVAEKVREDNDLDFKARLSEHTKKIWLETEEGFLPKTKKY